MMSLNYTQREEFFASRFQKDVKSSKQKERKTKGMPKPCVPTAYGNRFDWKVFLLEKVKQTKEGSHEEEKHKVIKHTNLKSEAVELDLIMLPTTENVTINHQPNHYVITKDIEAELGLIPTIWSPRPFEPNKKKLSETEDIVVDVKTKRKTNISRRKSGKKKIAKEDMDTKIPVDMHANTKKDVVGTQLSINVGSSVTQTVCNNYPDWCWDKVVKEETGISNEKNEMETIDDVQNYTGSQGVKNYPKWCWDKVKEESGTVQTKKEMTISDESLTPADIHHAALWPAQIDLYDAVGRILCGDECHKFNENIIWVHKVQARKDKFKKVGWYVTAEYHGILYDTSGRGQDSHPDFYRLSKGALGWFEVFGTERFLYNTKQCSREALFLGIITTASNNLSANKLVWANSLMSSTTTIKALITGRQRRMCLPTMTLHRVDGAIKLAFIETTSTGCEMAVEVLFVNQENKM